MLDRLGWIEPICYLCVRKQYDRGVPRSTWYYQPRGETVQKLLYMCLVDELYTKISFYGVSRMCLSLRQMGQLVNEKRAASRCDLYVYKPYNPGKTCLNHLRGIKYTLICYVSSKL